MNKIEVSNWAEIISSATLSGPHSFFVDEG